MNNLLRKKKVYQKKSTEREVYEQERYCQLKVEDQTGIIEKKGGQEFVDAMFERLNGRMLNSFICNEIENLNNYNITVKISEKGRDCFGKVTITKRQLSQKIKEHLEELIKRL